MFLPILKVFLYIFHTRPNTSKYVRILENVGQRNFMQTQTLRNKTLATTPCLLNVRNQKFNW